MEKERQKNLSELTPEEKGIPWERYKKQSEEAQLIQYEMDKAILLRATSLGLEIVQIHNSFSFSGEKGKLEEMRKFLETLRVDDG